MEAPLDEIDLDDLGIDPASIALTGGSAGAHLASIVALTDAALKADSYFGSALDIEWALDASGSVLLLQARPLRTETTRASADPAPVAGVGSSARTRPT